MFLNSSDLVHLLVSAQFLSVLVIGMLAAACCLATGSLLDARKYARLIKETEEWHLKQLADTSERHDQLVQAADLLLSEVTTLVSSLDDELSEAWRQEEHEACEVDSGCQELYSEVSVLQTVFSEVTRNLRENQYQVIDIVFYRVWIANLQDLYSQLHARKQAITELQQLEVRLEYLEQLFCLNHHVSPVREVTDFVQNPLNTYQDLYEFALYKHRQIQMRREMLETGTDLSCSTTLYTESVEILERIHELLDGNHDLFDLFTMERIKAEAKEQWHDVLMYTSETRSAFLWECLEVSIEKYLQGFAQARRALLDHGPCGQKEAVKSYRIALVHWSCSQAILLVLRDREEKFTDDSLAFAYDAFDLALLGRSQEDLTLLGRALQTFRSAFEPSCFLL